MKTILVVYGFLAASLLNLQVLPAHAEGADRQRSSAVIRVAITGRTKISSLGPGSSLQGKLEQALYWRESELFPRGSNVRLIIEKIEARKKVVGVKGWPFVNHLFSRKRELVPRIRSAIIMPPDGPAVPLRATFISLGPRIKIFPEARKASSGERVERTKLGHVHPNRSSEKPVLHEVLTLLVEPVVTSFSALADMKVGADTISCAKPCIVPEGSLLKVMLMEGLTASKNRKGDAFGAELQEPVRVGSTVALPQGSLLHGVIAQRIPPRRLYRPGSIYLQFTRLTLPNGTEVPISASPIGVELDSRSHVKMDSEGRIQAGGPGKARLLLDIAVTGGVAKMADDATQLIIEAISPPATAASTAGVGRIAAVIASGIYMLTRHGGDVILPPHSQIDITLNRSISLEDSGQEQGKSLEELDVQGQDVAGILGAN